MYKLLDSMIAFVRDREADEVTDTLRDKFPDVDIVVAYSALLEWLHEANMMGERMPLEVAVSDSWHPVLVHLLSESELKDYFILFRGHVDFDHRLDERQVKDFQSYVGNNFEPGFFESD